MDLNSVCKCFENFVTSQPCSFAVHKNKYKTRQTKCVRDRENRNRIKINPYYKSPIWVWVSEPNQRHCISKINGISISLVDVFDFFSMCYFFPSLPLTMFSSTLLILNMSLQSFKCDKWEFSVQSPVLSLYSR